MSSRETSLSGHKRRYTNAGEFLGHRPQRLSKDDTASDRISHLPDLILSHILSFLPTKDAVVTSLLSRRWKFMWTNIHTLFFSERADLFRWGATMHGKERFAEFVNMVLSSINKQTIINKFYLEINENFPQYDITSWINTALALKVKMLEFCLAKLYTLGQPYPLSDCGIFTCETLEVLVLRGKILVDLRSVVFLPNVKTLHLEGVIYGSDECVCKLISGCSSLETLYVEREGDDSVTTFAVSSPTLRNLTFNFYDRGRVMFYEQANYKLQINAPALKYLGLLDYVSKEFAVENLCSLDEAVVMTKAAAELLQGLHNVKHLSLRSNTLKALNHAGVFPSFSRLTQLTVEAQYCGWNLLLDLVKGLDKLECITFSQISGHKDIHETCWRTPDEVPTCFFSCLRKMTIARSKGLEDELAMIAYVLENARVLETMTIEACYTLLQESIHQFCQKVSKLPRRSEDCKINFYRIVQTNSSTSILISEMGNEISQIS